MTFFFFSSRRRHTRYWRDWSSDVCSSDLYFGTDDLAISRNVDAMLLSANPLYYHDLEAYRFNQKGQIVDRDGKLVGTQYLVSRAYLNVLASKKSMSSYHKLKKHWQSTGKGIRDRKSVV